MEIMSGSIFFFSYFDAYNKPVLLDFSKMQLKASFRGS